MKKLCFLLILALLLSLGASAFAEGGVELIVMDGVPVVMESFGLELRSSGLKMRKSAAFSAAPDAAEGAAPGADEGGAGFKLPAGLAAIGESAFEGIPAARVEITENVISIGARAFADCENLTELVIPETVESIDDTALDGSANVTVYGKTGSEAQRFADDNGIPFVATDAASAPDTGAQPPVVLPFVPFN